MPENYECLKCPFCENRLIDAKSGKALCSDCYAEFEFDDRFECIFADTEKIRGQVDDGKNTQISGLQKSYRD